MNFTLDYVHDLKRHHCETNSACFPYVQETVAVLEAFFVYEILDECDYRSMLHVWSYRNQDRMHLDCIFNVISSKCVLLLEVCCGFVTSFRTCRVAQEC